MTVLLLLPVCLVSFTIRASQLVLGKTSVSLEAEVFSVYMKTHMGVLGCFVSAGREDPPYHTHFYGPCSQSPHYWNLYLLLDTGEK